jgi:hypothetical protein
VCIFGLLVSQTVWCQVMGWLVNNELGRFGGKRSVPQFTYRSGICVIDWKKPPLSRYPIRDPNWVPPEYKYRALPQLQVLARFNAVGYFHAALWSGLFPVLFLYRTTLTNFCLILGTRLLIIKGKGQQARCREERKSILKVLRGPYSQGINMYVLSRYGVWL